MSEPPPFPRFEEGRRLADEVTAEKLRAMAQAIIYEVIGGTADYVPGRGTSLKINRRLEPNSRCYVITQATPTALSAVIGLDTITYDVPAARTASLLGTLSGGLFTFTKPGFYLASYTASVEMDLSGASGPDPQPVTCQANLQLGGVTLASTGSGCSAAKIGNFDGFVFNDGAIVQGIDLTGVTGKTAAFEEVSVAACEGSSVDIGGAEGYASSSGPGPVELNSPNVFDVINTCIDVIGTATLSGGQQNVTLDDATIDVDTSLTVIQDSDPQGTAAGTMAGQTLVRVIRNSSGVIKILDDEKKQ